jgi:hypothetical protein
MATLLPNEKHTFHLGRFVTPTGLSLSVARVSDQILVIPNERSD